MIFDGLIQGWAYTWTIFCVSNKQVSHKQENKHVLSSDYWAYKIIRVGLYSGGGAYIWNEVSVSTCGGLTRGAYSRRFTVYTQSNITSISLVYRFTVKNRWIGKDSLLRRGPKDKGRSKRGSSDVCGRRFADGSIKNMQNTVEHIWEKILMNVMFVKKRFSVVSGYMQITLEVRTHTREKPYKCDVCKKSIT